MSSPTVLQDAYRPPTRVVQCPCCYGERYSPFTGDVCQACAGTGVVRKTIPLEENAA